MRSNAVCLVCVLLCVSVLAGLTGCRLSPVSAQFMCCAAGYSSLWPGQVPPSTANVLVQPLGFAAADGRAYVKWEKLPYFGMEPSQIRNTLHLYQEALETNASVDLGRSSQGCDSEGYPFLLLDAKGERLVNLRAAVEALGGTVHWRWVEGILVISVRFKRE